MTWRKIQRGSFAALLHVHRNQDFEKTGGRTNLVMNRILGVSIRLFSLTILAAPWARTSEAKEPPQFVPANVSKAGNIPYPTSSLDAGVVTLSVALDKAGQVIGVGILRDISSVSGAAIAAVRSWTYSPATLNGKPVASTLTVNIVYDPGFLGADNIPLPPPSQLQPISSKAPAFFPPQLNTARFAPYPAKAKVQGAVILNVTLDTTGSVVKVATLRDVPPLTASATGALKSWNFSPATYEGTAIQSNTVVAFVFRSPSAPLP